MASPMLFTDGGSSPADNEDGSAELLELLRQVREGEHDALIDALGKRRRKLSWERLPSRIILLRHGESEGNVDPLMYTYKGDSFLELTERGKQQAREAGERLKNVVGEEPIFVCLSPFERTQQTYLAACQGGFPVEHVGVLHVDPQIREQEFGNFQDVGLTSKVNAEVQKVGRFYYRRPNGESSADVFDRVNQFWDKLISDGNEALLLGRGRAYGSCLVVTHGLTIRLLLMRIFDWSVETFETVWNFGHCHYVTLRKNLKTLGYEICPEESFPPRVPWATREVYVVLKSLKAKEETEAKLRRLEELRASQSGLDVLPGLDKAIDELQSDCMRQRSKACTVVDYLSVPRPRTVRTKEVLARLVEGHGLRRRPEELLADCTMDLSLADVEFIDWWGDSISYSGKMLRRQIASSEHEPCWSIHGGRHVSDHRMAGNNDTVHFAP